MPEKMALLAKYYRRIADEIGAHFFDAAVVASVTGFAALPMASAYGATKAFLISMADSLRADLAGERSGVEVTVVAPGFVTTDLTDNRISVFLCMVLNRLCHIT